MNQGFSFSASSDLVKTLYLDAMNWSSSSLKIRYPLILGVLLLALYQLITPKGPSEYLSFVDLRWQQMLNASPLPSGKSLANGSASFFVKPSLTDGQAGSGTSETFRISGPLLRFEHSGRIPQAALPPIFTFTTGLGTEVFEFRPPLRGLSARAWSPFEVLVPIELVGQDLRLTVKVKNNADASSWYALRNRLDVFDAPSLTAKVGAAGIWGLSNDEPSRLYHSSDRKQMLNLGCLTLAAIGLFLVGSCLLRGQFKNLRLFFLFLIVGSLFHFRSSLFFYWDEWEILWFLKQDLYTGIVRTHNEHFIPFFFSLYYVEKLLFGDNYSLYLLVSYLLHAANALMLCLMLSALGGDGDFSRRAAQLVAFCFLVSGLHPENLHWVVQQVDLLCEGLVILALFAAVRFMNKGRWKKLLQVGVAVFSAPLFFGNGLIAAPKILALAVLSPVGMLNRRGEVELSMREWFFRVFKIAIVAGIAGGLAAALYFAHPPAAPTDPSTNLSWAIVKRMVNYDVTATHLGTFLRGLGIFPYLDARMPQKLFGSNSLLGLEPELGLGRIGLAISGLMLIVGLLLGGRGKFVRLWLLGEVIMFLSMALPSIGRTKYGLFQGLSLRYTYSTLVGATIVVFAFFCVVQAWATLRPYTIRRSLSMVANLYLLWLLAFSLFVSREERFYTNIGYSNLVYRHQLSDWRNALQAEGKVAPENDLSGNGTRLEGYAPTLPPDVIPGATAERVFKTLRWLNHDW